MAKMAKRTCANCGADLALHHYETNQCPLGGVEARNGRAQEFMESTFVEALSEADEIERMQQRVYELLNAHPDGTLASNALALAWQAIRASWYAVEKDDDGGHLDDVEDAFARWKKSVERHDGKNTGMGDHWVCPRCLSRPCQCE